MVRGDRRRAPGDLPLTVATRGFVGDFDRQCQQDGTCLLPEFGARNYISNITSVQFLTFSATFEAGACGVWRQSIDGNTGDIVCQTVDSAKNEQRRAGIRPLLSQLRPV